MAFRQTSFREEKLYGATSFRDVNWGDVIEGYFISEDVFYGDDIFWDVIWGDVI